MMRPRRSVKHGIAARVTAAMPSKLTINVRSQLSRPIAVNGPGSSTPAQHTTASIPPKVSIAAIVACSAAAVSARSTSIVLVDDDGLRSSEMTLASKPVRAAHVAAPRPDDPPVTRTRQLDGSAHMSGPDLFDDAGRGAAGEIWHRDHDATPFLQCRCLRQRGGRVVATLDEDLRTQLAQCSGWRVLVEHD